MQQQKSLEDVSPGPLAPIVPDLSGWNSPDLCGWTSSDDDDDYQDPHPRVLRSDFPRHVGPVTTILEKIQSKENLTRLKRATWALNSTYKTEISRFLRRRPRGVLFSDIDAILHAVTRQIRCENTLENEMGDIPESQLAATVFTRIKAEPLRDVESKLSHGNLAFSVASPHKLGPFLLEELPTLVTRHGWVKSRVIEAYAPVSPGNFFIGGDFVDTLPPNLIGTPPDRGNSYAMTVFEHAGSFYLGCALSENGQPEWLFDLNIEDVGAREAFFAEAASAAHDYTFWPNGLTYTFDPEDDDFAFGIQDSSHSSVYDVDSSMDQETYVDLFVALMLAGCRGAHEKLRSRGLESAPSPMSTPRGEFQTPNRKKYKSTPVPILPIIMMMVCMLPCVAAAPSKSLENTIFPVMALLFLLPWGWISRFAMRFLKKTERMKKFDQVFQAAKEAFDEESLLRPEIETPVEEEYVVRQPTIWREYDGPPLPPDWWTGRHSGKYTASSPKGEPTLVAAWEAEKAAKAAKELLDLKNQEENARIKRERAYGQLRPEISDLEQKEQDQEAFFRMQLLHSIQTSYKTDIFPEILRGPVGQRFRERRAAANAVQTGGSEATPSGNGGLNNSGVPVRGSHGSNTSAPTFQHPPPGTNPVMAPPNDFFGFPENGNFNNIDNAPSRENPPNERPQGQDSNQNNTGFGEDQNGNLQIDGPSTVDVSNDVILPPPVADTQLSGAEWSNRVVEIGTYPLAPGDMSTLSFFPLEKIVKDPIILTKLQYMSTFSASIEVMAQVSGSAMHSGQLLMVAIPYNESLDIAEVNDYPNLLQCAFRCALPGVTIKIGGNDPTQVSLNIPFSCDHPLTGLAQDFVSDEFKYNPKVIVVVEAPIRHSFGSTSPVNVTFSARLTNVQLGGNTFLRPEIGEYPGEKFSTKVSAVAGAMVDIHQFLAAWPRWALPVEVGAIVLSGIAGIARSFGHSRPMDMTSQMVHNVSNPPLATANSNIRGKILSLDLDQGVSIDARISGSNKIFEMDFPLIMEKPYTIGRIDWSSAQPKDTTLMRINVTPAGALIVDDKAILSGFQMLATQFNYWLGPMHYTFEFVAPANCSGTALLSYDPNGAVPHLSVNKAIMIDLRYHRTIETTVNWGSHRGALATNMRDIVNPVVPYGEVNNFSYPFHNGQLTLSVYSPLTPTGETPMEITVLVKAWADPSMLFFDPNPNGLAGYRIADGVEVDNQEGYAAHGDYGPPLYAQVVKPTIFKGETINGVNTNVRKMVQVTPSPSTTSPEVLTSQPSASTASNSVTPTGGALSSLFPTWRHSAAPVPTIVSAMPTMLDSTAIPSPVPSRVPTAPNTAFPTPTTCAVNVQFQQAHCIGCATGVPTPEGLMLTPGTHTLMIPCFGSAISGNIALWYSGMMTSVDGTLGVGEYEGAMVFSPPSGTLTRFYTKEVVVEVVETTFIDGVDTKMPFGTQFTTFGKTDYIDAFNQKLIEGIPLPDYNTEERTTEDGSQLSCMIWWAQHVVPLLNLLDDTVCPSSVRWTTVTGEGKIVCDRGGNTIVPDTSVLATYGTLYTVDTPTGDPRYEIPAGKTGYVAWFTLLTNIRPQNRRTRARKLRAEIDPCTCTPGAIDAASATAPLQFIVGDSNPDIEEACRIYSGEHILSTLQLLKKFSPGGEVEAQAGTAYEFPLYELAFPREPTTWNLIFYSYFGVRGGVVIHHRIDEGDGVLSFTRGVDFNSTFDSASFRGFEIMNTQSGERSASIHYPYYCGARFIATRGDQELIHKPMRGFQSLVGNTKVKWSISAGEDFSLLGFMGCPPLVKK